MASRPTLDVEELERLCARLRRGADYHESTGDIGQPMIMRDSADAISSLLSIAKREQEQAGVIERMRTVRSAVSASPFYTPERREAVLFSLDLIETGECPQALSTPDSMREDTGGK